MRLSLYSVNAALVLDGCVGQKMTLESRYPNASTPLPHS